MATLTHNDTLPGLALPSFRRLATAWAEYRDARRERSRIVRELNTCTDRELHELGLFRLDIPAIANGTYRR